MVDHLSPEKRSWNMSRIRSSNTNPEKIVRSLVHRLGFRFRLNKNKLPGRPDIVLNKYNTVVFVNGCFWHRHKGCKDTTTPKSNTKFWKDKFKGNVERDKKNLKALKKMRWKTIIVWECELEKPEKLNNKLRRLLVPDRKYS